MLPLRSILFAAALILLAYSAAHSQGLQWMHTNFPKHPTYSIVANDHIMFAGTNTHELFHSGEILRSTNGSISWTPLDSTLNDFAPYTLTLSDSILYVASDSGLYLSTHNGDSFTLVDAQLRNIRIYAVAVHGATLIAATDSGIYRAANHSDTFQRVTDAANTATPLSLFVHDTLLFATTQQLGVYRSVDDGVTWTRLTGGLSDTVFMLTMNGNTMLAATAHGMFTSTNEGDTWVHDASGFSNIPFFCIVARGDTIIAGTAGFGIYTSFDGGASWNENHNGFTEDYVYCLLLNDNTLFAGTFTGIFRAEMFVSSGVADVAPVNSFVVHPNPARDVVYVFCDHAVNAEIELFDMLGERVASAFGGSAFFDVKGLAPGLYVVCVKSGASHVSKMIAVVK